MLQLPHPRHRLAPVLSETAVKRGCDPRIYPQSNRAQNHAQSRLGLTFPYHHKREFDQRAFQNALVLCEYRCRSCHSFPEEVACNCYILTESRTISRE